MYQTRMGTLAKSRNWSGLFSVKRAILAAVCGAMAGSSVYCAAEFPILAAVGIAAAMIIAVLGLGASLSRLAGTVATLHTEIARLSNARLADSATSGEIEARQSARDTELLQRQDLLLDMTTALRVELASVKDLTASSQKPAEPSKAAE